MERNSVRFTHTDFFKFYTNARKSRHAKVKKKWRMMLWQVTSKIYASHVFYYLLAIYYFTAPFEDSILQFVTRRYNTFIFQLMLLPT